jgi:hypothetical protein
LVLFAIVGGAVEGSAGYKEGKERYEGVFEELWPVVKVGWVLGIIGCLLYFVLPPLGPIFALAGVLVASLIIPSLMLIYAGIRWLFAK